MSETPLKNQIIAWLKDYHYWFQYAGNRLLEGENVTDELANTSYNFFKEDYSLKLVETDRPDINFNEITAATAAVANLELQMIKEIENVNALAKGQAISINPSLTIIYGGNGAGKSGYIRLLNNAFSSRGDKNILQNVFTGETGEPTCKFTFRSDAAPYDLQYPIQKSNSEFSRFSVFDAHSVRVHLEQDNKLNFTPSGFEFFEKVLELYESLKEKLSKEIQKNRLPNDFVTLFTNENAIKYLILNLGANSDGDEIEMLGTFTQQDEGVLAELIRKREELNALDIPKKITELQKLLAQILEYLSRQQAILNYFKQTEIEQYKELINEFHKIQELARQEGISSLEKFGIDQLGTNEWKEFIKAARDYTSLIEQHRESVPYPTDKDNCLFCLRPLSEPESALINSYWKLLRSEAEGQLSRIIQAIKEAEKKLKELSAARFDESCIYFDYVNSVDAKLAAKWKDISAFSELSRQNAIQNLANKNLDLLMTAFSVSTNEFDEIISLLKNAIEELFKKNPAKELEELGRQIQFHNDKKLLDKLLEKVLAFVATHKWVAEAEKSMSAFNTKSITIKQGELFTSHITDKYTDAFNQECSKLKAPGIVNIVQRSAKISTLRKLHIAGVVANSVLSEGEQRAISLSDFLTEVQINPNNKGVFFDDPVTSQDHQRRERIALRLVDLAHQKQVIVFTHDIGFFLRLKISAEERGLDHTITTIRSGGGIVGIVSPTLPWIAQNVKARIGTLKDRLVRLKKVESTGSADDYLFEAKGWYILLREAWERGVEERLFKGVVERFLLGVQTQKLKKVEVTKELIAEIEKGMTESSNWLHDAGAGLNPTPPDTTKAVSDLKLFEDFATKCLPA